MSGLSLLRMALTLGLCVMCASAVFAPWFPSEPDNQPWPITPNEIAFCFVFGGAAMVTIIVSILDEVSR